VTHGVATHHHTDHALGASWFAARGARVIAHERCAAAMLAQHPTIIKERRVTPALSALFAGAEPLRAGRDVQRYLPHRSGRRWR
jgi:glyoxylase-like metal-dependent hydrolase (beta-lactamase superfamily II)